MNAIDARFGSGPATADETAKGEQRGMTIGAVRSWLRLEGLAALVVGLVVYATSGGNWLLLVPLILVPDVSILGYLAGPRWGAITYNLVHTWTPGSLLLAIGIWLGAPAAMIAGAILVAHVGMDRALGYGLKLPTSFQETHLGWIGRKQR